MKGTCVNTTAVFIKDFFISASFVNLLCYYAVQQIALGDAMALIFSAPLFTLLLEWIFISQFRRPKGIFFKLPAAFLLLTGIILVVQPPWLFEGPKKALTNAKIPENYSTPSFE